MAEAEFTQTVLEAHSLEQDAIAFEVLGDLDSALLVYRKVIIKLDIAANLPIDRANPDILALEHHQQDVLRRVAYISTRPAANVVPVEEHISTVQTSVLNPGADAPIVLGPPNGTPANALGMKAKKVGAVAWSGTKAGGRAVKTGAIATGKMAQETNEKHDVTGKVARGATTAAVATKRGAVAAGGALARGFKNMKEKQKEGKVAA